MKDGKWASERKERNWAVALQRIVGYSYTIGSTIFKVSEHGEEPGTMNI